VPVIADAADAQAVVASRPQHGDWIDTGPCCMDRLV
jgi:hypothetical protein